MLRIEPKIGLVGGYQPKIRPATTTAGAGASGAAAGQTSLSRELDDPQYRVGGDIEFRSVNFKYAGMRKKMLKDVSFKVKAGSFVGICGERGAGKTTMFKLLLRLYDPESADADLSNAYAEARRSNICEDTAVSNLSDACVLDGLRRDDASSKCAHISI